MYKNVLGGALELCYSEPATGFFRNGYCQTDHQGRGRHVVCAIMTQEFLEYSRDRGNNLMTAMPEYGFPGLKPDDVWCLCVSRWYEAYQAGVAPRLKLAATHEKALDTVALHVLTQYAIDHH